MKTISILSILLLWSCEKKSEINIEDLRFSDLNQMSIAKNGIKKTFLIADYNSKSDTIGFYEYDNNGNVTKEWRKTLGGYLVEYKYDSLNLVLKKNYKTDFNAEFNFAYEFNSDSLVLYKKYLEPLPKNIYRQKPKYSGIFKFDKRGLIVKSSQYQDNDYDAGGKYITEYSYDSIDRLMFKKVSADLSKITDTLHNWYWPYKSRTSFYYTDKHIDSTITIYHFLDVDNLNKSYEYKTLYNRNGLINMTVTADSLITFYKHQEQK